MASYLRWQFLLTIFHSEIAVLFYGLLYDASPVPSTPVGSVLSMYYWIENKRYVHMHGLGITVSSTIVTKNNLFPMAEGYPAAQGKYLDFCNYTIPIVGPYVEYGEEAGEWILLLVAIIKYLGSCLLAHLNFEMPQQKISASKILLACARKYLHPGKAVISLPQKQIRKYAKEHLGTFFQTVSSVFF
jgi:hypothetical protein